jgi:hypothetical protein
VFSTEASATFPLSRRKKTVPKPLPPLSLQETIAKKKLVIRKQRASFLCDLAVEKRKRSKLKMKHAVAIAQYARRLKHVVTTLTTHNTKLAK